MLLLRDQAFNLNRGQRSYFNHILGGGQVGCEFFLLGGRERANPLTLGTLLGLNSILKGLNTILADYFAGPAATTFRRKVSFGLPLGRLAPRGRLFKVHHLGLEASVAVSGLPACPVSLDLFFLLGARLDALDDGVVFGGRDVLELVELVLLEVVLVAVGFGLNLVIGFLVLRHTPPGLLYPFHYFATVHFGVFFFHFTTRLLRKKDKGRKRALRRGHWLVPAHALGLKRLALSWMLTLDGGVA
jgi:hypothetical protein